MRVALRFSPVSPASPSARTAACRHSRPGRHDYVHSEADQLGHDLAESLEPSIGRAPLKDERVIFEDGAATGFLPVKLIRGPQPAA